MRKNRLKLVLAVGDYVGMVLALSLVLILRYGQEAFMQQFSRHITPFQPIFGVWIIVLYIARMYDFTAPFNHRAFLSAVLINGAIATIYFYVFIDLFDIQPRRNLAFVIVAFYLSFYLWRHAFAGAYDRLHQPRAVAIVGWDAHARELAELITKHRRQGYRVVAVVDSADVELPRSLCDSGVRVLPSIVALEDAIRSGFIVDALAVGDTWYQGASADLYRLLSYGVRFYQLTTFWERFDESIPVYAARESWFLEHFDHGEAHSYAVFKRAVDLLVIVVAAPVYVPLGIVTAIMVALTSRGPVFFSQVRVGRNQRHYTIHKFRSMRRDAERSGAQWAQDNDPRVTRIGRFLRATRLDEIPQVWNVLKGDMSIIGPRPERPVFVDALARNVPHYHLRHLVRPGITGWAQVRYRYGASEEDAAIKLMYDLYYVKNFTLVLDVKIMLKTILTVLTYRGR